jgi:steroid delta-isomerase-like uncharacterized protein
MSTTVEENERLVREHFDNVWNRGEFDEALLAPDYRVHAQSHEERTLAEQQAAVERYRESSPDLQKEPEDVVATEEKVVVRYTMTGTHEGEFEGIPPSHNEIEIAGVAIFRVEDGRIAESWYLGDLLTAVEQMDALPESPGDVLRMTLRSVRERVA